MRLPGEMEVCVMKVVVCVRIDVGEGQRLLTTANCYANATDMADITLLWSFLSSSAAMVIAVGEAHDREDDRYM